MASTESKIRDPITGGLIDNPDYVAGQEGGIGITSDNLISASQQPYVAPESTPAPNVSTLNSDVVTPPLAATPTETSIEGLIKSIQTSNEGLQGESATRTQQEEAQGIPGLLKTQTDLSSQLKAIQNEALAIPLQLQNEYIGRDATRAGIGVIQTARLRTNAIQALGVSSLLESSRGNIALAQNLVDRAVAAKYDPKKEENATLIKNLELALKSPALTREQANRAQAQLDKRKAQDRAIALQELNDKEIYEIANLIAKNGGDGLLTKKIQEAKTKEEALSIAAGSGLLKDPKAVDELRKLQLQNSLLEKQIQREIKETELLGKPTPAELAKMTEAEKEEANNRSELIEQKGLVDDILASGDIATITGIPGPRAFIPGTTAQTTKNQLNQLIGMLKLENRQKLKGSGTISDFEFKILGQAASVLGTNLSNKEMEKQLKKVRAGFSMGLGLDVDVVITDPVSGTKKSGFLDKATVEDAIIQGYLVEYN